MTGEVAPAHVSADRAPLGKEVEMAKLANPVQVQKFLDDVDYPASRDQLVRAAAQEGADDTVRETLRKLPEQRYETPADVSEALGKIK